MILYDAVPSSNCERVKIALHEKGLAYEKVTLVLANQDQKKPAFLKLNPYGRVPVLDDGGKLLFESLIINQYLEEQYPEAPLWPTDPYLRARGRNLVDYALNYFHDTYWALRGEMLKKERDAAVLERLRSALQAPVDYLEEALGDRPYFLGGFSLADIDVWPRISRLAAFGALPQPRLRAWLQRMNERASVKALAA